MTPSISLRPASVRTAIELTLVLAVLVAVGPGCSRREPQARPRGEAGAGPRPGSTSVPAAPTNATTNATADLRIALENARAVHDPRERSIQFTQLFQRWLQTDFEGAVAYLRTLPRTSPEYTSALALVIQNQADRDPVAALHLATELVTTAEQRMVYNVLFAKWAERDPAGAAQRLQLVPAGGARENATRALAETWAAGNFDAAYAWARELTNADRSFALEGVLSVLTTTDPSRAIQLAQSLTGQSYDRTMAAALHQLISSDIAAAAQVVSRLPAGDLQRSAVVEVARTLAGKNPNEALSWAAGLTDPAIRADAISHSVAVWAQTDAVAATRYVVALPDESRGPAIAAVAEVYGRSDPQSAIRWASGLSDDARVATLSRIADSWAQRDGAEASRWVASSSGAVLADQQSRTLNATLSYWVLQDAAAARDFVTSLSTDLQAGAAALVAPLLAQGDPVSTIEWAQRLPNPASRTEAVVAAFHRWQENAPRDAAAWLTTANLAPDLRARLQKTP